tara:strand:- start:3769 stop:4509 length:741 start_codon:yes stop_codon:yes gene_type:complete
MSSSSSSSSSKTSLHPRHNNNKKKKKTTPSNPFSIPNIISKEGEKQLNEGYAHNFDFEICMVDSLEGIRFTTSPACINGAFENGALITLEKKRRSGGWIAEVFLFIHPTLEWKFSSSILSTSESATTLTLRKAFHLTDRIYSWSMLDNVLLILVYYRTCAGSQTTLLGWGKERGALSKNGAYESQRPGSEQTELRSNTCHGMILEKEMGTSSCPGKFVKKVCDECIKARERLRSCKNRFDAAMEKV